MRSPQDEANWWGGHHRSDDRITLLDLVRNRTLDLDTAALLWLLVENRSSIVVAAAPQLAGKTTLLTALIDFMPPWHEKVYTRGQREDFAFLPNSDPSKTYILVPELSDHTPAYLWGDRVHTLFEALQSGHSMAATMHADTPEQVIAMLKAYPVNIPDTLLHHLDVIVNLRLSHDAQDMLRRMSRLTVVTPGPRLVPVGKRDIMSHRLIRSDSHEAYEALGKRLRMPTTSIDDAIAKRVETLGSWVEERAFGSSELLQMVRTYYEDRR